MQDLSASNSSNLLPFLQHISSEINTIWLTNSDKTDEMKKLISFLDYILSKDVSLEDIFNQNETILQYFMNNFMNEVISSILKQSVVYNENGDDIALDLLYHIYKLFLKYHQNKKYAPLFEKIREIINTEYHIPSFFDSQNEPRAQIMKNDNPKKRYNFFNFNHEFCSDYIDKSKESENMFKVGDKVDILINHDGKLSIDKKAWIRGKIKSLDEENYCYIVESPELDSDIKIQFGSSEIVPEGKKTIDWEWRRNLKKDEIIDCFDRHKWFPSTICEVIEEKKEDGYSKVKYKVGFRLYTKCFENKDDKIENYKCFWNDNNLDKDSNQEEYLGDKENYDENIDFYSKRIQKFKSYTEAQRENLGSSYYPSFGNSNSFSDNKIQRMNHELENESEDEGINDDMFHYEINGKKNYIIGKPGKFSYYYALFYKKLQDDNAFEDFIKIICNKPNSEEIYNIFFTLYCALPYLHRQYLIENLENFKNSILNFINNLETKEIRNLPKELTEIITKFLKKVNKILKLDENNDENDKISTLDEIRINLSIKMLKTSIFDKRIQGLKALSEYISENSNKVNSMKILIDLIHQKEIIKEIFGANYHSQIISKSNKILALLLKNNEIKEDDIKLIWDCTQRGDLEAKTTIMKLLSDLAENLNENFINILLENIINTIDKNKINEKEIDFIYNLSIHGDNEKNKIKCCEYIYQCVLKLDLNDNNLQNNPIMEKLLSLPYKDDNYLKKILSMCENDLKSNNSSLIVLQILSSLIDKFTVSSTSVIYLKQDLEDFTKNDNLLILYKNNFSQYISRIKEVINKNKKDEEMDGEALGNNDNLVIDNYSHIVNIHKRIEFLIDWITLIYPSFDFVAYLKEILLDKPVSVNDGAIFYQFMEKFITEKKANESEAKKEKKKDIKNQLFKIFTENNQKNMTMSEFKLFIAIFFGINSSNILYTTDKEDNYYIHVSCEKFEEILEVDKLWNVIFQLRDEKVLNKAISIIFKLYKSKGQIEKLLNKCNNLIKNESTTSEIIDKCFKLLRIIIIESEKNHIMNTKSHLNLIKNNIFYLPLKLTQKNLHFYYNSSSDNEDTSMTEVFFGNTTLSEIKKLLIIKGKIPLKYIEIYLSKQYMEKIKNNKNEDDKKKENKKEENDFMLDDTYNNKSLSEILNNNYNIELPPHKIFIFKQRNMEKENLLFGNELNPKFKDILKQWFNEFTDGTGKMDKASCGKYISKVTTTNEIVPPNDSRVKGFFEKYDPEETGYVTEDKFLEFYTNALNERRDQTVWENIKSMGIREDLHRIDEPDEIPYIENGKLPRYCLGNDKSFIETLFDLFNKFQTKKEIYDFLFFLSTNKEIYDNILNNLNKTDEKNFDKIFDKNNKILEQLYILTIIESILQDINVNNIDFTNLFESLKKKENREQSTIVMSTQNYEYFDDIDINKKKSFLKDFITSRNFEKMLKYMNKLLTEYKFDNNTSKNDSIVLNICYEKSLKIINIIYNACFNNKSNNDSAMNGKKSENENDLNDCGIYSLDSINLSNIINEDSKTKETISQIGFLDFSINLIKFITNLNNNLNSDISIDNNDKDNLLQNSFNLLINLISYNSKLLTELDSKEDIKHMLSSLIKNAVTCKNEKYKSFYFKCLIDSIKNSSNENNIDNKYLNLLFELTNNILNEMISEESINNSDNISSKSSILFFDFFSLLSSTKTDDAGNEFLFRIYDILFTNLKEIDNKKLSDDIFIGLMNILIKRIKNNRGIKKVISEKKIEEKTLIELIFEKIYKNEEKEKEKSQIIEKIDTEQDNSKFINLDLIKNDNEQKKKEISNEIKNICNDYLIECFKSSKDPKIIKDLSSIIKIYNAKKGNNQNEDEANIKIYSLSTKNYGHVGLKNIGCICYMNSIMQQMYMVPTFRYAIMGSDDQETPKPSESGRITIDDDNILHQLQTMYTFLTYSEKEDYNPKYFCYSFKDFDGNPTNPMIQQDSQEFYNNFCDKIENCLKKTKYKYIINDIFVGRTCSSVICESCKKVSNRFEDFYNLSMEVKNINNLNDSLLKMTMPEKIEDFKCSNCNKNVTISKRTSLCDLPNVLFIHLKRFYMNYEYERTEKINSRFEFPVNINLKEFCIEDIASQILGKNFENEDIYVKSDEYYNYELKGINIHMGSADGGHYFSLINIERDGKGNILLESDNKETKGITNDTDANNDHKNDKNYKWLKFNDSHVSIFNINDIEKECFGGASKGSSYNFENFQNAYMLIYERKKKNPIRIIYDEKEVKEIKENLNINNENFIKINKDNRKEIKKKYNINKISKDIDEPSLYKKIFHDEEKDEYYKYIPFYNIDKFAPRAVYNQVIEKNKKLEKMKNNNEKEGDKYNKEFYEILLNNISMPDFDILSDNYSHISKNDLIHIFLESIFNLVSNKFPSEEEKTMVNSRTKVILNKIILPFIESNINKQENGEQSQDSEAPPVQENASTKNFMFLIIIFSILIQKDKLEKIYRNDLTTIFDNSNVELFSRIIKHIMEINYQRNFQSYKDILDNLIALIDSLDSPSTYPVTLNNDTSKPPLYYVYEMVYQAMLKDKNTTNNLISKRVITTLLGKLSNGNTMVRNIIYDMVTHLIKNTDAYNDKLFDINENEEKFKEHFSEKSHLIKSINNSIVELLFEERVDLLIILVKILQYDHHDFSFQFNIENILELFEYSIKNNKIMDIIKVLYSILEINDKYTFTRINYILGYPTMIIKHIKKKNNDDNDLYEEEKKEEEEDKKEDAENENINKWPLFGERLILEENEQNKHDIKDPKSKLKRHIFKYIGPHHKNENYCLLPLLLPDENKDKKGKENDLELIEEKDRIQLIYNLLKLMLLGKGNYCIFKYIYLLPARSLYYNNLYEEMIDIIEKENSNNNNLYNLEEIKKNAEKCIKRIKYEVDKKINELKCIDLENKLEKCKLPEKMEQYYVSSEEVEEFIGANPNMIQSEIVKEEIQIIAQGSNMYLVRLEYFTKYKTPDEIRNELNNKNTSEKKGEQEKDDSKKEEETELKKEENENKNEIDNDDINSDEDNRCLKMDISKCNLEVDGRDFIFSAVKNLISHTSPKIIIEDSSVKEKKKAKSSLIKFIMLSQSNSNSDMHIKVSQKDTPNDVKENYYYPDFFVDSVKHSNISNFMNLYRIRNDLPFLKSRHIGINIDIKKPREYE